MDFTAFTVAISISILVSLDSLVVMLIAKRAGMTVEEGGIFFGKGIKRKIGEVIWKIGFIPMGSYVKIRGMIREDDEVPEPGDFDQASKGSRMFVMFFDKLFFGGLLLVLLLLLPGGDLSTSIDGMVSFWSFVLGGSDNVSLFPGGLAEGAWFPFAAVLSWVWAMSLLPVGGSKTQHLLYELLGSEKLKQNTALNMISTLAGLGIVIFLVVRMFQYISRTHPDGTLDVWLGIAAGFVCSIAVVAGLVMTMGMPVPPEEPKKSTTLTDSELPPPDMPSRSK